MFFKRSNTITDQIKAVNKTGLFLQEWYREQNPDVAKAGMDPTEHYVRFGETENRRPNPFFEPDWYKERAKGTAKFKGPALVHYSQIGWKKGRAPSKFFSPKLYYAQYPSIKESGEEALQYHLKKGRFEGKAAFPTILEKETLSDGTQSATLINDLYIIAASGLFDETWYRNYYSDLCCLKRDLLFHFVHHGALENRQPNRVFQTDWYRQQYGELIGTQNPLIFYIQKGWKLGHDPAPNFCSKRYFKDNKNLDVSPENTNALVHYLTIGSLLGCKWPHPEQETRKPAASKLLPVSEDLRTLTKYESVPLSPKSKGFNSNSINIHWVIPDFAAGGGGHMTIFRMVSFFERMGHKQTIWINNPTPKRTDENGYDDIQKHFQFFSGDLKILNERFKEASGDIIIATDCWTIWPVQAVSNFKRRFYFVQDFEPSFHPMGANYLAAEETYKQDIDCICASPWLAKLMQEKYGRWARHFWLAADTELYHPASTEVENNIPRIAFYSRHFTARRAVELGMLALEVLAKRGIKFEVDFFGAPLDLNEAPFPFVDHGVASPEQLAELFQYTEIGVVFSATNYSLVPQEMMACRLPIVELKGESTECIFPEGTVSLAEPHPVKIADAIEALLNDKSLREQQAKTGYEWVQTFSWEASAKLVEAALLERLAEFGKDTAQIPSNQENPRTSPKVSVVIPTLNAGSILDKVLKSVTTQQTLWPYEILVIDSGSTDTTLKTVAKYPLVKLHRIDTKDFNHGGTRNLGAELTSGEYIAFLTHDALPANPRWLHNLVMSLEKHPDAAGAFGKHLAYPEASAYTKRDLKAHFEQFALHPLCVNKTTDKHAFDSGKQSWHQFLHFYSDNNSIMRRSVWEKIPYRPVKFGEDQVWADDVIKAGFSKVYAVRAAVYHSHDFNTEETQERCKIEAAFFKHFFNYCLVKDADDLENNINAANKHDTEWGQDHGLTDTEISERLDQNKARLTGYFEGYLTNTDGMF